MWGICLFNIQKRKRPDFHKPGRLPSHIHEIVEQYIGFVSFQYNLLKPYFITFFPLMM